MRLIHRLMLIPMFMVLPALVACTNEVAGPTPVPTQPPTSTAIPLTATALPTATAIPTSIPTPVPASLSGRVLWGMEAVPHARVELRAPDWRVTGDETPVVAVTAGAAGQFLFSAVPPGEYSVVAVWPDASPSAGGTPVVVLEPGQAVSNVTLKLEQPLKLLEPDITEPVATLPTIRWEPLPGLDTYRVWIIDRGTTELLVNMIVRGDRLDVAEQLETARDYTLVVSALGSGDETMANATADFTTAETPAQPRPVVLPAICGQPGLPTFLDRELGLCFAYPADHMLAELEGQLAITGPTVGSGSDLFPSLTITTLPGGDELATVVDDYLATLPESEEPAERVTTTVAGAPAEILEPVPGQLSSRQVVIARGSDTLLLSITPTFRQIPAAEQDFLQRRAQIAADSLFETAIATIGWLPRPGENVESGLALPATCVGEGHALYIDAALKSEVVEDVEVSGEPVGLCLAIPPGFTAQRTPQGMPRLIGPALDASLSPVRATFALEPPEDAMDRSLDDIVGAYLETAGSPEVTQSEITVGGEPAALIEGLTAGRGSQEVFLIFAGQVYHLVFQPSPTEIDAAADDVARLMEAVLASFAFLPTGE